jgi:ssRNA-specific RNase YbeY (16S rRNA maturation enzyme)
VGFKNKNSQVIFLIVKNIKKKQNYNAKIILTLEFENIIYRSIGIEEFINFLFVHGVAHLKGFDHQNNSDAIIMEKFEKQIRSEFNINF